MMVRFTQFVTAVTGMVAVRRIFARIAAIARICLSNAMTSRIYALVPFLLHSGLQHTQGLI